MRIYLKGNKPFYGGVVNRQADEALVQLLPNPCWLLDYFNGNMVYYEGAPSWAVLQYSGRDLCSLR